MTAPLSAAQWQARVTFHAPTFVIGVVTGVVLLFAHQHLTSTVAGGFGGTPPAAYFRNYYNDSNGDNSAHAAEDAAAEKGGLDVARGGWNGGGDVLPGLMAARHVGYNTSAGVSEGKLNVHIVAHSHDDMGWLSTVDQYYAEKVASIIDSVVANLEVNPHRKFVQVEQGFFYRWWQQQSDYMRTRVKTLVANNQLLFTNGGWVMHDEASVHYTDMLHQMTLGHRFLKREFNAVPTVTWQVDPFGHSATHGYLLTAQAGMDAVFVGRVDIKEGRRRKDQRTSEFLWRASQTFGRDAQVFTGILDRYTYYPPELFKWEPADDHSLGVKDNLWSSETNVKQRVNAFVNEALQQAASYRTDHIMWTMGEDFSHADALPWFSNLDKLIHYVNLDGRVNALYSSPAMYVDAKHRANESWPTRTGDMFPYDEHEGAYWTGYFSSRPSFKYMARVCSSLLLATTAAETLVGRGVLEQWDEQEERLETQRVEACESREEECPGTEGWRRVVRGVASTAPLEDAVAIAQHHDAITGTAKQHVSNDYALRLHAGAVEASQVLTSALAYLITKGAHTAFVSAAAGADAGGGGAAAAAAADAVPNTDGSPTIAAPSGGGGKEEWQGGEEAAQWRREHAQRLLTPLQLAFAVENPEALAAAAGRLRWRYSLSGEGGEGDMQAGGLYSLPPNVAVISMQELSRNHLLLRLAHLYEAKEHPSLSTMASVPLRQLFASRQIISLTELSLTANQKKADMRPPMVWREETTASTQGAPGEVSSERPVYGGKVDPQQLVVELGPLEIRTFALTFKPFST